MPLLALRSGLRSLRRSPGFATIAVVSLALGLGLTTTVAAMIDAVVHPRVPYADPERLFRITHYGDGADHAVRGYDKYLAVRAGGHFFDGIAGLSPRNDQLRVDGRVEDGGFAYVTADYFEVLGVTPRIGRAFSSRLPVGSDDGSAVVSYGLWRRAFAGRHALDGAAITIGDRSYDVIGVMPPGVQVSGWEPNAWLVLTPARLTWPYMLESIVRLRGEGSLAAARAELAVIAARLTASFGTGYRPFRFEIRPARTDPIHVQDLHVAMAGAAMAVLLIACANLANLTLARGLNKRRELVLRMALGATRLAIVRQMLVECLLVALAGGMVGVFLSIGGVSVLASRMPPDVALVGVLQPQFSWRVFLLATAATAFSALAFGLLPALRASNVNLSDPLNEGAGTTTGRPARSYRPVVVVEISLSMVLLMAAGLLARSASRIGNYDFGFDGRRLWYIYAYAPPSPGTELHHQALRFGQATQGMMAAARSLPGILAVASMSERTTSGGAVTATTRGEMGLMSQLSVLVVSPEFLRTLGISVVRGRDFEDVDAAGSGAVIVDQAVAARLWLYEDAVGQMIKLGGPASSEPWLRVIGVSRNATLAFQADPDIAPEPGIYVVQPQVGMLQTTLIVRVASDGPTVIARLQDAMTTNLPAGRVAIVPLLGGFRSVLAARRFIAGLFALLAVFALVLSSAGLYGVLAYAASQRRREFGVRVALGASRRDILRLVFRDGLVMTLTGTAIGGMMAVWTAHLLSHWLYTVHPADAVSLIAAEGLLLAVSMTACTAPAISATSANPVDILRVT